MDFTVIAYKPDSDDYCRGCHMESCPSDFSIEQFAAVDSTIEHIANVMFDNTILRVSETGYDIYVVYRGSLYEYNNCFLDDDSDNDNCIKDIFAKARERAKHKHDAHKKAEEKAKRDERESEAKRTREKEKALLAELKEKYPEE